MKPPAFVFGLTINGLSILRSLGRRGIVTYGFDSDPSKIGYFSRFCRHRVLLEDPLRDPDAASSKILRTAASTGERPVLILASDDYLGLFSARYAELAAPFLHSLPPPDVIDTILDKRKLAAVAEALDLPRPRTVPLRSAEEAEALAPSFGFPVLLKPAIGYLTRRKEGFERRKLIVVPDAESLKAVFRAGTVEPSEMMLQEVIPGPDSALTIFRTYYARSGRPLVFYTKGKLRQYPIHYGYGCANESRWEPEVARLGLRLLDHLGYRGLGGVEFKRDDRDGRFKLIEINGRTAMTDELPIASGVDFPWIAYQDLTGGPVEEVHHFEVGVKWFRVRHDVAAFRQYRKEGSLTLGAWLKSYRGRRVYSTFSWKDPFCLIRRFLWETLRLLKVPGGLRRYR
jgi:predicted ATP-grasp superfamily ATP-dependent carboligase